MLQEVQQEQEQQQQHPNAVCCNKCNRFAAQSAMWQLVGGGTRGWECRSDADGCIAEQRRLAVLEMGRVRAEREARDRTRPSTDAEFFAEFGVNVADLLPGTHYRDGHRHFMHPPTERTFKYNSFGATKRWSETTYSYL
jgi:hypothetical protein